MKIFISLRKLSLAAVGCDVCAQSAPRKSERVRQATFGSTVDYVLEHAPCRVMVISVSASSA
jgi:nucleotide-binding universal stress UspA family protein